MGRERGEIRFLHDGYVSGSHAVLSQASGQVTLRDLGSSNGTYVNGRRVAEPQPLEDGDRIRFGPRASFVVRYGGKTARDTLEILQPAHARSTVEVLAKRKAAGKKKKNK